MVPKFEQCLGDRRSPSFYELLHVHGAIAIVVHLLLDGLQVGNRHLFTEVIEEFCYFVDGDDTIIVSVIMPKCTSCELLLNEGKVEDVHWVHCSYNSTHLTVFELSLQISFKFTLIYWLANSIYG